MIHEIHVFRRGDDPRGQELLHEIQSFLNITSIQEIRALKVYRLEGLSLPQVRELAEKVLRDPLTQHYTIVPEGGLGNIQDSIEVGYKPGVMNPESASIRKAAHDMGLTNLVAADSSWRYQFYGTPSAEELSQILERLLVNKTVEQVISQPPTTLLIGSPVGAIQLVPITSLSLEELTNLSRDRQLFLSGEEMQAIQLHCQELGREPTDGELETFAQTWSEHCGHKTFKARLVVDGQEKPSLISRIMEPARRYFGDLVLSAFGDNSGVIDFYDGYAICGKVETHNSPSAIEPYGGSGTGVGGVLRDIAGTGQGAKVIASTDMFCFAPPNLEMDLLPSGCLHPRHLLRKVVAGVRDYGNRMGIPTNNGSIHFHSDFRAKPTVIVGAYGILPTDKCQKGEPRPGDYIMSVGGRTGRDGIHGATFSSGEMTAQTISVNASAVQIGNAIEEKRTFDALLQCRDQGLVRAITDCGAGGFASAIGEMGSQIGARVELERAPLKYSGLAPWEIWLSESQERMVISVAPENAAQVIKICQEHNVEATVLGVFTDDQRLTVTYQGQSLCDLSMDFLHHGLPKRTLKAVQRSNKAPASPLTLSEPASSLAWVNAYKSVLGHWNVCSKQPIVQMYDHTVQGTSALPPFTGTSCNGPNDAVVMRPLLGKPYGLIVAHGLNPVLNRIDPYAGSLWAAIEALANLTAVGGNYRESGLIDNFIWPYPDEESLWDLDQSADACNTIMGTFKIPFVSGKDSLSSTYRRGEYVLKIPPVLCVSVFGKIPDVKKTVTADFKGEDSFILLVGTPDTQNLGGSIYYDVHHLEGGRVPLVDLVRLPALFVWLHKHIKAGNILACHDISEGGLATAVAEMCFGGNCGASLSLPTAYDGRSDHWLFNETAGCFLIEVSARHLDEVLGSLNKTHGSTGYVIGRVTQQKSITVTRTDLLFTVPMEELMAAWQQPMKEVFHS